MTVLDLVGKPCPLPVIEAKKALREAAPGQEIRLLLDDEEAVHNLAGLAADLGHGFRTEAAEGGRLLVVLTVVAGTVTTGTVVAGTAVAGTAVAGTAEGGLTVVIGREALGDGPEPDLGRALMKAFIQSLTELDQPPERLFFFNSGIFLTVQGSGALDDLRLLETKGAAIGSCGACLNYYQLTDKLQIGSVTNMFAITSALAQAPRVIAW